MTWEYTYFRKNRVQIQKSPLTGSGDGGSPGSVLSVPELDHLEVHRVIVFVYACVCMCMCGGGGREPVGA